MKDVNRRDFLLITLLTLSCVLLAVSRPDNTDVRTVVWDYTAFLMMGAAAIWLLTEVFAWFGDVVAIVPDITVPSGMSKNGLLVMAQNEGIADRETLEKLSEEELIALLKTNGRSKVISRPTIFVVVAGVFNLFKEVIRAVVAKSKWFGRFIRGVLNRNKIKKTSRRNNVRRKR